MMGQRVLLRLVIFFVVIVNSLPVINSEECVAFDPKWTFVWFSPFVSREDLVADAYDEDELQFLLKKVSTKFSRIVSESGGTLSKSNVNIMHFNILS